jgi:beta-carotene 3-hydroxylase
MSWWILALISFVLMEPLTYGAHRWLMHGPGRRLHRSHHRESSGGWEANDLFPLGFAAVVVLGLAVGFNVDGFAGLVPVGVGITTYGAAYALVHDVYTHGRLRGFGRRRVAGLDHLAEAHRLHHRFGGEPYGMLVPIVPASLRARAARTDQARSGSRPSHVP